MYRSSIQPPLHLCLWLTGQLERPRFYCAAPHISLVALPPGAHPGFDLWSVPPLQKPVIPDMRLSVSFVGLYLACCQLLRVVVVFPITRYFCRFFPIFRYIFHVFVCPHLPNWLFATLAVSNNQFSLLSSLSLISVFISCQK